MSNPVLIATPGRTYDSETALSVVASVSTASGTVNAKAGHLLAHTASGWVAAAVATNPLGTTGINGLGVLLEDASLGTTAKNVQVMYYGFVSLDFIREAGFTAAVVSDDALINAPGKLIFK